jgi:hypothetical protein
MRNVIARSDFCDEAISPLIEGEIATRKRKIRPFSLAHRPGVLRE